jgi:5'-nucleotidase
MNRHKIPTQNPRILLCNDDGIYAPGLKILEDIARTLSDDIWVVAPAHEQSGASHSLSLRNPLRIHKIHEQKYAVEGTPTDCILLAINNIMSAHKPDLVLSGINAGSNMGEDVTYSGTVAAAMEATLLGIPAIALSQVINYPQAVCWDIAQTYATDVVRKILTFDWPKDVLINVNFPHTGVEQVNGVRVTCQGRRKLGGELEQRTDPRGLAYYWIGTMRHQNPTNPGTDLWANSHHSISVTPLHLDLTHSAIIKALVNFLGVSSC